MYSLEEKVLEYGSIRPDRLAVGFKEESVTYGELKNRILHMAKYLDKQGIGKNNIVLLQAETRVDYVSAYLALHCIGAVVAPVDRKATWDTVEDIKKQLKTEYIIGTEKFLAKIGPGFSYEQMKQEKDIFEYHPSSYSSQDMYDILFTTGTTGVAKGVVSTRASVLAAISNEIEGPEMTEDEILLIPIPLNHSFGIGKLRAVLYLGASVILQNGVSMVTELRNNIEQFKCNAMICVPSTLEIIERQAGEEIGKVLGGLHFIEAASAPFGVDLKKKMIQALPNVHILNRYGSTETPAAIYLDMKKAPDKLASIGKAIGNVGVKIVDENRQEIISSAQNIGKLVISGPMLMQGYYQAADMTETVLQDGWMYTRDMAYIDEDGYIFLMGRADDVINTGGKKFSPLEVEDILMKSGMFKECAIVGIEDPQKVLGNIPVLAYVSEMETLDEKEINLYLRKHIEKYKIPVQSLRVKALPRNYMGKLDRNKIRKLFR